MTLTDLITLAGYAAVGLAGYLIGRRRRIDHRRTRRGVAPVQPTTLPETGPAPNPPPKRPTNPKES